MLLNCYNSQEIFTLSRFLFHRHFFSLTLLIDLRVPSACWDKCEFSGVSVILLKLWSITFVKITMIQYDSK